MVGRRKSIDISLSYVWSGLKVAFFKSVPSLPAFPAGILVCPKAFLDISAHLRGPPGEGAKLHFRVEQEEHARTLLLRSVTSALAARALEVSLPTLRPLFFLSSVSIGHAHTSQAPARLPAWTLALVVTGLSIVSILLLHCAGPASVLALHRTSSLSRQFGSLCGPKANTIVCGHDVADMAPATADRSVACARLYSSQINNRGDEHNRPCGRWTVSLKEPSPSSLRRTSALARSAVERAGIGAEELAVASSLRSEDHKGQSTAMPVTTSPQAVLASFPTFTPVFDERPSDPPSSHSGDDASIKPDGDATPHASAQFQARPLPNRAATAIGLPATTSIESELRRDSCTTRRSDSTDSSPTTTISTLDSTLTDPSPSSSPETPASHNASLTTSKHHAMNSLHPRIYDGSSDSPLDGSQNSSLNVSPVRPGSERSEMSGKRFRNAKGLSINTTGINTKQAPGSSSLAHVAESSTSSLPAVAEPRNTPTAIPGHVLPGGATNHPVKGHAFSPPASPSAILPSVPPPRRSRLGLTINTGDGDSADRNHAVPPTPSRLGHMSLRSRGSDLSNRLDTVPETPAPLSAMRETQETGEALFSPVVAPGGGMQLPPFARNLDPTLPTPGFGPEGGMSFPSLGGSVTASPATRTLRPALNLPTRPAFDAPSSQSVIQHTVSHRPQTPQHELPLSREAKSPGYSDGPVCIYPPSVFLYHQPTRKEAREFDLVINVAREVENPFLASPEDDVEAPAPKDSKTSTSKYADAGVQCSLIGEPLDPIRAAEPVPEPSSAVSDKTFVSAFERQADEEPETPRASHGPPTSSLHRSDPEYVHLPWEHNSKVYDQWLSVCQLIDARVRDGKRVLIHCQLGVSRSASLVVAYGLYLNPRLSPDEARERAKRRSRWIDLNMHFMYELGDFRKLLLEQRPEAAVGGMAATPAVAAPSGAGPSARRAPGPAALSRTMTDSFLVNGGVGGPVDEGRPSPRGDNRSGRRASTPNQGEARFDPLFGASAEEPTSAHIRASWSPTSAWEDGTGEEPSAVQTTTLPAPKTPAKQDPTLGQTTPRTLPFRAQQHHDPSPDPPLPPSRPAPPPPAIDADRAQSQETPPPLRTAEKKELKPITVLPPPSSASTTPKAAHSGPVLVENTAPDTSGLPPPNLTLPPKQPSSSSPNPPRRALRPMPSLPAGFNSSIRTRRLLLQPSAPSPPPAVPPLPRHLQNGSNVPSTSSQRSHAPPSISTQLANAPAAAQEGHNDDLDSMLMSPRAAEFTASPFHCHTHRSSAGDLAIAGPTLGGGGGVLDTGNDNAPGPVRQKVEVDPRSPHAVGSEPIVRSIDDLLG